jgi:hypothetical protein
MHLQFSETMRSRALHERIPHGRLPEMFTTSWPAFYLGSVAPDYQTICGVPRQETHFYKMPPQSISQGWRNFLARNPGLYPGKSQTSDQAAFIAAYMVHLYLDLSWHFNVVIPYFADTALVGDFNHAYLLHLTLLTYLDKLALNALPATARADLAAAEYDHWLPFASNKEIDNWQQFLQEQLSAGGSVQTVKIFAGRLRMTPDEFNAKIDDPDWMDRELFSRIPLAKIEYKLRGAIEISLDLVEAYYYGRLD